MNPSPPYAARVGRLQADLPDMGVDAFLTFHPAGRRYLTGFTGTAGAVLVAPGEAVLLTDGRYVEQAGAQSPHVRIVEHDRTFWPALRQELGRLGVSRLGFEKRHVAVHTLEQGRQRCPGIEWVGLEKGVERYRILKDEAEIEAIRRAQALTDEVFADVVERIEAGMTERRVALELLVSLLERGGERPSFDFIVASGPRSALPHGVASGKRIESGELLTLDFGVFLEGYASDMTRTVSVGPPADPRHREIYEVVLRAQEAALAGIRAGRSAREIDGLARRVIEEAGYGANFPHGLGHGVGLEIHEEPRLTPESEEVLEAGMVVTVEPGIYLPGAGGVRIEDLVVVREDGPEILTRAPKEWREIG